MGRCCSIHRRDADVERRTATADTETQAAGSSYSAPA